jgi:peptide/nickel transport system substrate-binding protein
LGRLACLSAPFFVLLPAFACSRGSTVESQVQAPASATLTVGLPVQTGQDPLFGAIQASRLISREGLTLPNRDGRAQPRLAETWSESSDGLTWRFKLRKNAFFHDGSRVDSTAVKASLERSLATPDIDQFPGLTDIVSIETPAADEVLIRVSERSTFLLDDLGVSILKTVPGSPSIGTGPYQLESTTQNELVMRAFKNYYRGVPQIERIVWKSYPTVRTAWAAMMRGEIDFLYEIGPEAKEFIEPEASVQIFTFLRSYQFGVIFNAKKAPFDRAEVRRALNHAIDREKLVAQILRGQARASAGSTWPLHWAHDASLPTYAFDPSRSVALLDAAKIPAVVQTANSKRAPSRFHFVCLIPETFPVWERVALAVQRDLAEIGVDMEIAAVPFPEFNRRIAAHDFDAVFLEFVFGNSPSRPFTFWYSKSKQNSWGFEDEKADVALDGIRRAQNESEYRAAFRAFQVESLESAPAIFLAIGQTARAVNRRFTVVAAPNSDILHTIGDWRPANANPRMTN